MRTEFDTERKEQALIIEKSKVRLLEKEAYKTWLPATHFFYQF